ncbi:MAG: 2-hydroxyacid dehydrogenase, partial [Candidatus Eremiobacteraeota bacterium]|nr:2-hydroxyacid dehydrogenase [Candidatus Eremiobacteraeota bacterium]
VSSDELDRFPNIELVAVFGVGLDGLDLEHLHSRKLLLANTPSVLDDSVAEHAMALMLAASRKIREADEFIRDGRWGKEIFPLAHGLRGKRCGIVGLGGIGHKIATLAKVFGLELAYHGRRRQENVAYKYFDKLIDLAKESDILVLALPGGEETQGIVNRAVLQALGAQGLLINIARGSVVDEEALVQTLQTGELGAAALDVYSNEPNISNELSLIPNVVLTPHIGCATYEARRAMSEFTMENLRAHFSGQPIPGLCQR